jgi:tetratricopeptide (TPR) repeat protein
VKINLLIAGVLAALSGVAVCAQNAPARIVIDYPAGESVFPPDMAAPTFLWRDPLPPAARWQIEITFSDGSPAVRVATEGEKPSVGEIDPRCVSSTNELPKLTPQQAAARAWKPDTATWAAIKRHSGNGAATVTISGFAGANSRQPISRGSTRLHTAAEPVGAPIFYRDVPLMPSEVEKGVIKPLATTAVPLIAWRLRDVSSSSSRVLMEDLHSCANCHSFSGDGKTLGLSLDGPSNDKGLFTLVPVEKKMTIRNEDVISWPSFRGQLQSEFREGLMPQVSPDGRRVVTTITPPNTPSNQFYYTANFKDYRFLQVFYPTRGILAWYDRGTRTLHTIPGADDPRYVHTDPVWSPDGKYLVFARAEAQDAYPAGRKMAEYPNDPAEVPMKYDLYRIPFNDGKGGVPEAIEGASQNGMSNSFPKISPDGRWLVFVQARNGQLLRPDSRLFIVPAGGGKARLMNCNTPLMNSWHSFSPNGRWLVFSSKSRSPYTQMFLTHIDAEGRDTPPILIENSTAANRAVNLPEFVNISIDGIEHIDTPAIDFYRQFDTAVALAKKGDYTAAIPAWTQAIAMGPDDARAHNNFGLALAGSGRMQDAIEQYQAALAIKPEYPEAHNNLGIALAATGRADQSIGHYQAAVAGNPGYAEAHNNLGMGLAEQGRAPEAVQELEAALAIRADFPEAHNNLATLLSAEDRLDDAIGHYQQAIAANPAYVEAHNNLGAALARQGKLEEAVAHFRKALELDPVRLGAEANLGRALFMQDKFDQAIPHLQKALDGGAISADLEFDLGVSLSAMDRSREAIPHLERAAALSPENANFQAKLARAYATERQFDRAIVPYQKALAKLPDSAELHNQFAVVLAGLHRLDEAIGEFEKALQLSPGLVYARYNLGESLMSKGRGSEALAQWRQALRQDPDNVQVLNEVAWVLATSGDPALRNGAEAVTLAERAAQLTARKDPAVLATLAAAYAEAGNFEKAIELEQLATDLAIQQGHSSLAGRLRGFLASLQKKTPIRQR